MTSASTPTATLLKFARAWLLPVVVGTAAIGLHFRLHVPPGPLPPPSPAELEAAKAKADKEKQEAERKQREEDRKAGRLPPAPQDLAYEAFRQPRSEYLLSQLWQYYGPKSYNNVEPVFEAWQTAHRPLLNQIFGAAKLRNTGDPPAITLQNTSCHTIRCRFTLRSTDRAAVERMADTLESLELDGASLWREFSRGKLTEEPGKRESDQAHHKLELTVGFVRDLPPIERIQIPGVGPLRQARTPTKTPPIHGVEPIGPSPTVTSPMAPLRDLEAPAMNSSAGSHDSHDNDIIDDKDDDAE